jgi:hypothetical protein
MDIEQEVTYLHTRARDGLATRVEMFFSREEALEAAGLQE